MNPPTDTPSDSAAIRAEIDQTRHRMDETIDALGERFKGRHLVDEALHLFRSQTQNGNMNKFKDTLTRSADSAAHAVVDTVKANPIPLILIGAGVAYYLYNRSQATAQGGSFATSSRDYRYAASNGNDFDADARNDGVARSFDSSESSGEQASEAVQRAGERLHDVGDRVRDQAQAMAQGAREMGTQVAERSRELYREGKDRIASTIDQHPLQSGLACLALGLLAGIALPTSEKVRRKIGPQARALRRRADTVMASGRQVVRRAAEAAREEAKSQGLTVESLKAKATQVGEAASNAAKAEPVAQELSV